MLAECQPPPHTHTCTHTKWKRNYCLRIVSSRVHKKEKRVLHYAILMHINTVFEVQSAIMQQFAGALAITGHWCASGNLRTLFKVLQQKLCIRNRVQ